MGAGVHLGGEQITFSPQGQEGTLRTGQDGTGQDMKGQDREAKHAFVHARGDKIEQDRANWVL